MNSISNKLAGFILVFLSLIWGSSFILIKKALVAFNFTEVAMLRLGISCLAFLPVFIFYIRRIKWEKSKLLLIVGLTGSGIPSFLFPLAQTEISSATAGVLNSLTPIFTFIIGIVIFKSAFNKHKLSGVLIGFIGALLLLTLGQSGIVEGNPWYALIIVIATLCYALNVNLVKVYFQEMPSILISSAALVFVGLPFLLFIPFSSIPLSYQSHPNALESLIAVSLLAIFATAISTMIFFYLVQKTNAVYASSVAYVIPVVALAWGFLDGEPLNIFHLMGLGLILVGVYLIRK